jgi:hypothetical protein
LYWNPEQPPPSTETRKTGEPGSLPAISEIRVAACWVTVTVIGFEAFF